MLLSQALPLNFQIPSWRRLKWKSPQRMLTSALFRWRSFSYSLKSSFIITTYVPIKSIVVFYTTLLASDFTRVTIVARASDPWIANFSLGARRYSSRAQLPSERTSIIPRGLRDCSISRFAIQSTARQDAIEGRRWGRETKTHRRTHRA